MADRELFRDALVSADLFRFTDSSPVFLTVLNPYGVEVANALATPVGDFRYTHVLDASVVDVPGVWTNVWTDGTNTFTQNFTVGRPHAAGITKYDCRVNIAARVGEVHHGSIASEETQVINDTSLIGGSNEYDYWWMLPHPESASAGRVYRITHYNGTGLVLNEPVIEPFYRGEPYVLTRISPREIDQAMRLAIAELSPLARLEIHYGAIPVSDLLMQVPTGLTYVSSIHATTGLLTPGSWSMRSGRRVGLVEEPDEAVLGMTGVRDAFFPVWEDSLIETDEATTVSRAAMHLHAARAAGQGIDQEEHLRRQLAAQEEYNRTMRNSAGRIPPGSRAVLE